MMVSPVFEGLVARPADVVTDMLFVPVFQDHETLEDLPGLDEATGGAVARARAGGEFRGKLYEFFITPVVSGWKASRIALVGAGQRSATDVERLRKIAASCGYTARLRAVPSVAFVVRAGLDLDPETAAQTAADGLSLAEFDSGTYKRSTEIDGRFPDRIAVVSQDGDHVAIATAVARGRIVGLAANDVRTLANEPGNVLTPRVFADRVAAMAARAGLVVDLLDEARITALKMGMLLGVSRGSAEPPRLVVIRYEPKCAPAWPVLGLVGKGVTFDTGGISIKPAESMELMKADMSGGAAVAGAICALAALGAPYRVIGVIPMVENMPGGRALKPGDVLTAANGKTVEINNTDAEGRLILGDALWYAEQLGATHLVDVATLTGACMVALGRTASGLFGMPDEWVGHVRQAGRRGGDRLWQLPIYDEYRDLMKSEIADIINSGGRIAGAGTAALFLSEFVTDRPWAHLDIAGTAWSEERKAYQPKGATGVALRTLIALGLAGAPNPETRG